MALFLVLDALSDIRKMSPADVTRSNRDVCYSLKAKIACAFMSPPPASSEVKSAV
jgi:hypothetical protein